jgi:arsenate reductase
MIPFPSEEVTPPVTKMYLTMGSGAFVTGYKDMYKFGNAGLHHTLQLLDIVVSPERHYNDTLAGTMSRSILVLCTGNSCRSQIAEAYLRKAFPDALVCSAGVESHGLNPNALSVMAEDGIDISAQRSKTIDELPSIAWDLVITVCDNARSRCPVFPGRHKSIHRSFEDPASYTGSADQVMPVFRRVRDEIKAFANELTNLDILSTKNT